jgi:hypothetical protein
MKSLVIIVVLAVTISSNSLLAEGRKSVNYKPSKKEYSLKIKLHPYSLITRKVTKPNPIS